MTSLLSRWRNALWIVVSSDLREEWKLSKDCFPITWAAKSHFHSDLVSYQAKFLQWKTWDVLLQVKLELFCSMRWRRYLNEQDFVKIEVFTNPEEKSINDDLQVLLCIFFNSRFNETRRQHFTITCKSCPTYVPRLNALRFKLIKPHLFTTKVDLWIGDFFWISVPLNENDSTQE